MSSYYFWTRKGVFCAGGSGSVYRGQAFSTCTCYKMHETRLELMLYFDVFVLLAGSKFKASYAGYVFLCFSPTEIKLTL